MLLDIELEDGLQAIGRQSLIKKDVVIPKECPFISHSVYRPEYNWLFGYERKLFGFLETWLKEHRYDLIGENGLLAEALSNSFTHGHNKNSERPIRVVIYLGEHGLIVRIEDEGAGFDVRGTFEKFMKKGQYFHLAGNGLRHIVNSRIFGVFYNHKGNVFHLLHLFHQDFSSMPVHQCM